MMGLKLSREHVSLIDQFLALEWSLQANHRSRKRVTKLKLFLGKASSKTNGKHPIGELKFNAHREFKIPDSITISVYAGCWYLSFNYDNELIYPTEDEIREAIDGNICRCTGYEKIIESVQEAANKMSSGK